MIARIQGFLRDQHPFNLLEPGEPDLQGLPGG